jgi:hypothetical protein
MLPQELVGLRRLYLGFIASRVVITANNLGVFDCLKKPATTIEAAKKLKLTSGRWRYYSMLSPV